MLNIWIIALFMIVLFRDSLGEAMPALQRNAGEFALPHFWVWTLGLLPYVAIVGIVHLIMIAAGHEMDRRGNVRAVAIADRTLAMSRPMVVLVHFGNVFLLGWLSSARAIFGDVILLDELVCLLPPLCVFVVAWWSLYPIERRMRDAVQLRNIETSATVYPMPTRGQYVLTNIRNQLTLTALPVLLLASWSEIVDQVNTRLVRVAEAKEELAYGAGQELARPWRWVLDADVQTFVHPVMQIVGVAVVIAVSPLLVRWIWDTVRLGKSPLRDRLAEMCRGNDVRFREILIWRTYGTMINGAVVGMFPRLRYVLLTDALLDSMPQRQVEAVMAHEIAHARCGHMPWLIVVLISSIGCAGAVGSVVVSATVGDRYVQAAQAERAEWRGTESIGQSQTVQPEPLVMLVQLGAESVVIVGSLVVGLLCFGLVSRRFEWQADAFAAKALTAMPAAKSEVVGGVVSPIANAAPFVPQTTIVGPYSSTPQQWKLEQDVHAIGAQAAADVLADSSAEPIDKGVVDRRAVDAMAGALQNVAQLNHIPRHRGSFRHGSIAQRQQKLRALVGVKTDRLPIDRTVRWIKRLAVLGIVSMIALALMGY